METLANAAYLSNPNQAHLKRDMINEQLLRSTAIIGQNHSHSVTQHLPPAGVIGAHANAPPSLPSNAMPQTPQMMAAPALHGPGRHLQILDHTVHRIDTLLKSDGHKEKEMVVSNLRHFTLKIGVLDPQQGIGSGSDLPLRAELLYENGQLVEHQATCEPLLVGKTEVVALNGIALFKLRITSLSSHRDKQRFRIRVSPCDSKLLLHEPGLSVVTTPMKCVTKLSHRSSSGGPKVERSADKGEAADKEGAGTDDGGDDSNKRKRLQSELDEQLDAQREQLRTLNERNAEILEQLAGIKQMLKSHLGDK